MRLNGGFRAVSVLLTSPTLSVGQVEKTAPMGANLGELNTNSLLFGSRHFDVAANGKQLVLRFNPDPIVGPVFEPKIHAITNWLEELRQREPK